MLLPYNDNLYISPPFQNESSKTSAVVIGGDLHVSGNIIVNGQKFNIELEEHILSIKKENEILKNDLTELQEKIEMLWFSPGMPGYESAKMSWEEKLE